MCLVISTVYSTTQYIILAINLPFFSIRLRAFFNGFHQKAASIDRCIDSVCFLPSDDALYLLTDASITHKVDPDSLDSLDEVCIISS